MKHITNLNQYSDRELSQFFLNDIECWKVFIKSTKEENTDSAIFDLKKKADERFIYRPDQWTDLILTWGLWQIDELKTQLKRITEDKDRDHSVIPELTPEELEELKEDFEFCEEANRQKELDDYAEDIDQQAFAQGRESSRGGK